MEHSPPQTWDNEVNHSVSNNNFYRCQMRVLAKMAVKLTTCLVCFCFNFLSRNTYSHKAFKVKLSRISSQRLASAKCPLLMPNITATIMLISNFNSGSHKTHLALMEWTVEWTKMTKIMELMLRWGHVKIWLALLLRRRCIFSQYSFLQ